MFKKIFKYVKAAMEWQQWDSLGKLCMMNTTETVLKDFISHISISVLLAIGGEK